MDLAMAFVIGTLGGIFGGVLWSVLGIVAAALWRRLAGWWRKYRMED